MFDAISMKYKKQLNFDVQDKKIQVYYNDIHRNDTFLALYLNGL